MIAFIKGTVARLSDGYAVIDNGGLGYIVHTSAHTLGRLTHGAETTLHTCLRVKEDDISLYGFLTLEELRLFRMLVSVSGVGPKVAMSVLAVLSPEQFVIAVVSDDAAAFSKAPGVGKKTAQRIALELRDKLKTVDWQGEPASIREGGTPLASSEKQDAVDALLALGYSRSEGMRAVLEVAAEGMPTEQIIKQALKTLTKR
jgi:Holliday junction DNA helicase RuvA